MQTNTLNVSTMTKTGMDRFEMNDDGSVGHTMPIGSFQNPDPQYEVRSEVEGAYAIPAKRLAIDNGQKGAPT